MEVCLHLDSFPRGQWSSETLNHCLLDFEWGLNQALRDKSLITESQSEEFILEVEIGSMIIRLR